MHESADIPRRHTPEFQVELDALIDRLNTGEAVVRSDVGWQMRSSVLRLCLLAIPAAFVTQRFAFGDADPGIGFFVLGAMVLVALVVEAFVVVRKLRGRPTFALRREGFVLDGGGIVPWTHVFAILPAARRRVVRGQTLIAYLEAEHVHDVSRQLPWRLRLRRGVALWARRLDRGADATLPTGRFVVVLRHPAESADVVADLANFLRLRAHD